MKKTLLPSSVFIIFALLYLSIGCETRVEKGISEEEVQILGEKYLEIWNEGNLNLIEEICTPEYIRHYVDIYEDIVGMDGFKQWVIDTRTSYPDFMVSTEKPFFTGDKIVTTFVVSASNTGPLKTPAGVLPPTGKQIEFRGVSIMQIKDGKIDEEWLYFNQTPVLLQLGYTIMPPESPEQEIK